MPDQLKICVEMNGLRSLRSMETFGNDYVFTLSAPRIKPEVDKQTYHDTYRYSKYYRQNYRLFTQGQQE